MTDDTAKTRGPLLPLFSYIYDPFLGVFSSDGTLQVKAAGGYDNYTLSRLLSWNPLWGIWKAFDGKREFVLEAYALTQSMYDFCGGMLVSSAGVLVNETRDVGGWGDGAWRAYHQPPPGLPPRDRERLLREWGNYEGWAKWSQFIPSINAWLGAETVSQDRAVRHLKRSLAGAIMWRAQHERRGGIFAADRAPERTCRTREILQLTSPGNVFPAPAVLYGWRDADCQGDPRVAAQKAQASLQFDWFNIGAAYHDGVLYRNPNSGATVSLVNVIADFDGRAWPDVKVTPEMSAEWRKLSTREYASMAPQVLFHNG